MDENELKAYLDVSEFAFEYNEKDYYIENRGTDYLAIDDKEKELAFTTFDALLNGFIVDGKPLKEILADIYW